MGWDSFRSLANTSRDHLSPSVTGFTYFPQYSCLGLAYFCYLFNKSKYLLRVSNLESNMVHKCTMPIYVRIILAPNCDKSITLPPFDISNIADHVRLSITLTSVLRVVYSTLCSKLQFPMLRVARCVHSAASIQTDLTRLR